MGIVPETSTTLLRELATDSRHARWTEFVQRYQPMMESYLRSRFPTLDAEEVVAETLVALVDVLKNYQYDPKESGRFHNYLTGILRHKALRVCRVNDRIKELKKRFKAEPRNLGTIEEVEEEAYRQSLLEVALSQFFSDDNVAPRTKEVFRRIAILGELPEVVAKAFLIERHTVDQIKSRSVARIREIVKELEKANDGC